MSWRLPRLTRSEEGGFSYTPKRGGQGLKPNNKFPGKGRRRPKPILKRWGKNNDKKPPPLPGEGGSQA